MNSFDSLVNASKSLDVKEYMQHFDQDRFIGLNSDGSNWNSLNDLKEVIEPGFTAVKRINSLAFTNIRISVIDENNAILVNEYEQQLVLKNGQIVDVVGGGTQVWSKLGNDWKLVSVSSSHPPVSSNQ